MKSKLNSIDASLKYGQFFTGGWLVFFYSFLAFCAVVPISSIVYAFLVLFGVEIVDYETVIVLSCSSAICVAVIAGLIYVLVRNNRLKKKIQLWLTDAVELTAQTMTEDRFRTLGHPVAETKLQVIFYYGGQRIVQSSEDETKEDKWYKRNGFYKIHSKYADKTIRIYYSPTYRQVMIKKNK